MYTLCIGEVYVVLCKAYTVSSLIGVLVCICLFTTSRLLTVSLFVSVQAVQDCQLFVSVELFRCLSMQAVELFRCLCQCKQLNCFALRLLVNSLKPLLPRKGRGVR